MESSSSTALRCLLSSGVSWNDSCNLGCGFSIRNNNIIQRSFGFRQVAWALSVSNEAHLGHVGPFQLGTLLTASEAFLVFLGLYVGAGQSANAALEAVLVFRTDSLGGLLIGAELAVRFRGEFLFVFAFAAGCRDWWAHRFRWID